MPNPTALAGWVAIDAGGTLIKVVKSCDGLQKRIFQLSEVDELEQFLRGDLSPMALTGGALSRLPVHIKGTVVPEIEAVALGALHQLKTTGRQVDLPFLVVNIGSGTGFISCRQSDEKTEIKRVGGSCFGGGTFSGLANLLCSCSGSHSFDEHLAMAIGGDNFSVDLSVGDIYLGAASDAPIGKDLIASSFAKAQFCTGGSVEPKDRLSSLLKLFSYNTGQLIRNYAYLEEISSVVLTGTFVQDPRIQESMRTGVEFWDDQRKLQVLYIGNEGFLGCLGAASCLASGK